MKPEDLEHIPGDVHITRVNADGRWYEAELLEALRAEFEGTIQPHDVFVDGGAHVGNHSAYFLSKIGVSVIAFEPHSRAFVFLRRNLSEAARVAKARGIQADFTAFPFALGCGVQRACVEPKKSNSGMTRVVLDRADWPTSKAHEQTVMVPLGSLGDRQRCRLIKLDVEGWEPFALRGARPTIERDGPVLVVEAATEGMLGVQTRLLEGWGYQRDAKRYNATPTYVWRRLR